MAKTIAFFDIECGIDSKKIYDIGAVKNRNDIFHKSSAGDFAKFITNCEYICGHNIIQHDIKYLNYSLGYSLAHKKIDTLYLSPLLFPKRPYHALLKNDKIQSDEFNNPVNDAKKAEVLFYDEINAFQILPDEIKEIYYALLHKQAEFKDFFTYIGYKCNTDNVAYKIQSYFSGRICQNAPVKDFVINNPVELAYALALINTGDSSSITPPWLLNNYHGIENIIRLLCNTLCREKCSYCSNFLDVKKALKKYFDFDNFRTYNGEPLQEMAAQAAVEEESLLAIFPTGGGKSLTFQIPALMAGNNARGLTVVISPLLLLMCDKEAIEVQKILPFLSDTWPLCRIGRAVIRASQSCRQSCNKSQCPACGCRSHHSCTHAPQFSRSFPAREWGSVLQRQGACGQCP